MNDSRRNILVNCISAMFIFLFAYTALSKLINFPGFKIALRSAPFIADYASFIAWLVILFEWLAVFLLFYPYNRIAGLSLSLILMTLFTGYIAFMLVSASHLPCSCGGVIRKLTWHQHLFLNLFLMLAALIALIMETRRRKTSQTFRQT